MGEEFWIAAFNPTDQNWYILDSRDMSKLSGPYADFNDVIEGIKTRAYRLSRGWKP